MCNNSVLYVCSSVWHTYQKVNSSKMDMLSSCVVCVCVFLFDPLFYCISDQIHTTYILGQAVQSCMTNNDNDMKMVWSTSTRQSLLLVWFGCLSFSFQVRHFEYYCSCFTQLTGSSATEGLLYLLRQKIKGESELQIPFTAKAITLLPGFKPPH